MFPTRQVTGPPNEARGWKCTSCGRTYCVCTRPRRLRRRAR